MIESVPVLAWSFAFKKSLPFKMLLYPIFHKGKVRKQKVGTRVCFSDIYSYCRCVNTEHLPYLLSIHFSPVLEIYITIVGERVTICKK